MTATAATISRDAPLNLSGRVPELDGIRGVAIGMVILWHLYFVSGAAPPGSLSYYLHFIGRLFWSGVDLFFVLSGFLIGGILLDNRDATNYFKVFYTRRFFRIVPAYLLSLGAFYVLARLMQSGAAPRLHFLMLFQLLPWAPHLFFLQNFWMAARNTAGIFVVTWSLCIEEQFYLTLPLLVRFLSPKRLLTFVASAIVSAPIFRIALLLFTVLAIPVITSVAPTLVLNAPTISPFTVNGSNLTGATFSFVPAFTPAAITVSNVSITNGTSATMTLTLATNAAGNTLTIISADPNADFDGDGLTNIYENAIGSNYVNSSTTSNGLPDGWALFYTSAPPLNAGLAGQIAPNGKTYLQSFQQGLNPLLNTVAPSVANGGFSPRTARQITRPMAWSWCASRNGCRRA